MKWVFLLVLALAAQEPSMPPPGNPNHEEPLPGMSCVHEGPGVPATHACVCHATCMENRGPNGEPDGTFSKVEDNVKCRAACHKTHCACKSDCETS
jgi:hypothetical protein